MKVDLVRLERAVRDAEARGPLPSRNELFKRAKAFYNSEKRMGPLPAGGPISKSQVYYYVVNRGIETKTTAAKEGRPTAAKRRLLREALDALEVCRRECGWRPGDPRHETIEALREAAGLATRT